MNTRSQHGFTLIEMVIALAILGVSLTVLYGVFETALTRTGHDAHLSEATLLAQSLLAHAGSEWPLADGTREGASLGYSYTLIERELRPAAGEAAFTLPTVRVTASIRWPEGSDTRGISLSTLKLSAPVP